jgi:hypothetical protein
MRVLAVGLLLVVACAVAGCGGDSDAVETVSDTRSPAIQRLAALCDQARTEIEAFGLPSEGGAQVIRKWAARGGELVDDLRAESGGTAVERAKRKALVVALDQYYEGLALAASVYEKTKSSEVYAAAVDRAKSFFTVAERITAELGVPECTTQPFPNVDG